MEPFGTESDDTAAAARIQLNDVSVLYPMAKSTLEFDAYIKPEEKGTKGVLFPQKLYEDATGMSESSDGDKPNVIGGRTDLLYKNLRMVAFRVDPCFAQVGPIVDANKCDNQIRLIFQSLSFVDKESTALDGGVHAFFRLTRTDLTALVKELVAARKSQPNGDKFLGPLNVHPLLAMQGLTGDEAKKLRSIVLKYAGESNLIRFTVFTPANGATSWSFSGFDVKAKKTTAMEIPTLPPQTNSVTFFRGFTGDLGGKFTPPTNSADNMQLLGDFEKTKSANAKEQSKAIDATFRIENPNFHSPDTIDCASCHMANPGRVLTAEKLNLVSGTHADEFQPDGTFVTKAHMKQPFKVGAASDLNLHVFSYRSSQPMVAPRVINETASVVAYLNSIIKL